jgi:hypothetical protein
MRTGKAQRWLLGTAPSGRGARERNGRLVGWRAVALTYGIGQAHNHSVHRWRHSRDDGLSQSFPLCQSSCPKVLLPLNSKPSRKIASEIKRLCGFSYTIDANVTQTYSNSIELSDLAILFMNPWFWSFDIRC